MSVALALTTLKFTYTTWYKIPKKDRERIIKALKEGKKSLAKRIAKKYHNRFKNPRPHNIKCSICGKRIRGTKDVEFGERMAKLRRHRKKKHKKAHKQSAKKAQKTKAKKKGGKKK